MIPAIPLLAGWFLFWIGTITTTCTQCDTDSMVVSAILSLPFYLVAIWLVSRQARGGTSSRITLVFIPLLAYQAWIAGLFTYAVTIRRGCGCWAYWDNFPIESYIPATGLSLWIGPLLLAEAFALITLIAARAMPAHSRTE
jgi:hypothetical protein